MPITSASSTSDVLRETGDRLRIFRLQQNIPMRELALQAGVGIATVQRAEAGLGMTLATLVKLLRALGRLEALEAFLPPATISPLQLAKLAGRDRQRAGSPRPQRSHRPPGAGAHRPRDT